MGYSWGRVAGMLLCSSGFEINVGVIIVIGRVMIQEWDEGLE